jgi:aarF domain-containing kinase
MLREGDFSMLKVWAGLEARKFLQASIEDVSFFFLCDVIWGNANVE